MKFSSIGYIFVGDGKWKSNYDVFANGDIRFRKVELNESWNAIKPSDVFSAARFPRNI